MTNEPVCGNTLPLPKGSCQMQIEAQVIEVLIDASLAVLSSVSPDGAFEILEIARNHASRLQLALDEVRKPGGVL